MQQVECTLPYRCRSFSTLSIDKALDLITGTHTPRLPVYYRPLYLYGKGQCGALAQKVLGDIGRPIERVIDVTDLARNDLDTSAQVAVAVITDPYGPIQAMLDARGFECISPFYDLIEALHTGHPLNNGWVAAPLNKDDENSILQVWLGLDSEVSRDHYLSFLAWRTIREEWVFPRATVTNTNRYFIPSVTVHLQEHETFLDGGAYDGAVSERFRQLVPRAQCVLIEPDPNNGVGLPVALSDIQDTAPFHMGYGWMSRLGAGGNRVVQTTTIDQLGRKPTFIKLHLEGHELPALKGAINTLHECRPIIAATIYHNDDGLYRTALWLMDNLDGYWFAFRNHTWCGAGAVIYAVPKERHVG